MKVLTLAFVLLSASAAYADTNSIITTNWVKAPPEIRIVNGTVYNSNKSTNFVFLQGYCVEVLRGGIYFREPEYRSRPDYLTRNGNFLGGGRSRSIETVFIRNFTNSHEGAEVAIRAMPIGKLQIGNKKVTSYDYGLPAVIPVIVTNSPH